MNWYLIGGDKAHHVGRVSSCIEVVSPLRISSTFYFLFSKNEETKEAKNKNKNRNPHKLGPISLIWLFIYKVVATIGVNYSYD